MVDHAEKTNKTKKLNLRFSKKQQLGIMLSVLGMLFGVMVVGPQVADRLLQPIDTTKYQVVYLANGQVYFGKLQNTRGDYLVVRSPYTAQSITSNEGDAKVSQTTLLKVSEQVYGPDNSIAIKSSQVLFWQNLRDDSKISQALKAKQ